MANSYAKWKVALLSLLPATITAYLGAVAIPFGLLILAELIDYGTGAAAAPYRGQVRNSNRGIEGIKKKLVMLLALPVGVILDIVVFYIEARTGVTAPLVGVFPIASIFCLWLLCNELLSIAENLDDIGISIPFIRPLIKWVRKTVQDKAPLPEDDEAQ